MVGNLGLAVEIDYEGRPSYMVANQAMGGGRKWGAAVFFLASALYMLSFFVELAHFGLISYFVSTRKV
jgi:hypothetical protein